MHKMVKTVNYNIRAEELYPQTIVSTTWFAPAICFFWCFRVIDFCSMYFEQNFRGKINDVSANRYDVRNIGVLGVFVGE